MKINPSPSQPLALEPMEPPTPAADTFRSEQQIDATAAVGPKSPAARLVSTHVKAQRRAEPELRREFGSSKAVEVNPKAVGSTTPKAVEVTPKAVASTTPKAVEATAKPVEVRRRTPKLKHIAATAAVVSVAAVVWLLTSPRESEAVRQPVESPIAASLNQSAQPTSATQAQPPAAAATGTTNPSDPTNLEAKVLELRNAGNWNVLVLHAAEWTRRAPKNAVAWTELSRGYAELRQFDDAIDAAAKAAKLSPQDPLLWRALGHLNLEVDELPAAGTAFDRALALNPDDADAQCGAATVAQKLKPKAAGGTAARAKSADGSCPALNVVETASVTARSSSTPKRGLSGR